MLLLLQKNSRLSHNQKNLKKCWHNIHVHRDCLALDSTFKMYPNSEKLYPLLISLTIAAFPSLKLISANLAPMILQKLSAINQNIDFHLAVKLLLKFDSNVS